MSQIIEIPMQKYVDIDDDIDKDIDDDFDINDDFCDCIFAKIFLAIITVTFIITVFFPLWRSIYWFTRMNDTCASAEEAAHIGLSYLITTLATAYLIKTNILPSLHWK